MWKSSSIDSRRAVPFQRGARFDYQRRVTNNLNDQEHKDLCEKCPRRRKNHEEKRGDYGDNDYNVILSIFSLKVTCIFLR